VRLVLTLETVTRGAVQKRFHRCSHSPQKTLFVESARRREPNSTCFLTHPTDEMSRLSTACRLCILHLHFLTQTQTEPRARGTFRWVVGEARAALVADMFVPSPRRSGGGGLVVARFSSAERDFSEFLRVVFLAALLAGDRLDFG
jgi:hypothetical protein